VNDIEFNLVPLAISLLVGNSALVAEGLREVEDLDVAHRIRVALVASAEERVEVIDNLKLRGLQIPQFSLRHAPALPPGGEVEEVELDETASDMHLVDALEGVDVLILVLELLLVLH